MKNENTIKSYIAAYKRDSYNAKAPELGYMVMAMQKSGVSDQQIQAVIDNYFQLSCIGSGVDTDQAVEALKGIVEG